MPNIVRAFALLFFCPLLFLVACSSCGTNKTFNSKEFTEEGELKCAKIFDKYLQAKSDNTIYEIITVQDGTCMLSEVIDSSTVKSGSRRLTGNKIYIVDLSTNEVRPFLNR
jgi:hypothetical protein